MGKVKKDEWKGISMLRFFSVKMHFDFFFLEIYFTCSVKI